MFSLTSFQPPFFHYQCGWQRMFIAEELQFCLKCNKGVCQFCLYEEMESLYCRQCLDVLSANEAATYKNKCSRYVQCPNCFSIMQIMGSTYKKQPIFYYMCLFCQWDTIQVDFKSSTVNNLLMKINYYKGKYFKTPQQVFFEKILEFLKYNQEEQIKLEKFQTRAKRKTVTFFVPGKLKKIEKYTNEMHANDEEFKRLKFEEDKRLKPFEEIYLTMLEFQKQDQINLRSGGGMDDEFSMGLRSPRDGTTPKGGISTPRSLFGGPTTPRSFFTSTQSTPKGGQIPAIPTTPRGSAQMSASKESSQKTPIQPQSSSTSTNDEDAKDLPPEEFKDFLSQYDTPLILSPENPNGFPSLDEALDMEFEYNSISNIEQRHKNLISQPRIVNNLFPTPLYLLTKRTRRCKTCTKFLMKPNINPTSTDQVKVDFQLVYHVPKVTIYRFGKYQEGVAFEILIKFANPNFSKATIYLTYLENLDEDIGKKVTASVELPKDGIQIETTDSMAADKDAEGSKDQATIQGYISPEDKNFIYKKLDNFIVLRTQITLKPDFNFDSDDVMFGFVMRTDSQRFNQHQFDLSIPIFLNIGKVKKASVPPK